MSGILWQEFPIGDSMITYDVFDIDGTILTNCVFDVHVDGKYFSNIFV